MTNSILRVLEFRGICASYTESGSVIPIDPTGYRAPIVIHGIWAEFPSFSDSSKAFQLTKSFGGPAINLAQLFSPE